MRIIYDVYREEIHYGLKGPTTDDAKRFPFPSTTLRVRDPPERSLSVVEGKAG